MLPLGRGSGSSLGFGAPFLLRVNSQAAGAVQSARGVSDCNGGPGMIMAHRSRGVIPRSHAAGRGRPTFSIDDCSGTSAHSRFRGAVPLSVALAAIVVAVVGCEGRPQGPDSRDATIAQLQERIRQLEVENKELRDKNSSWATTTATLFGGAVIIAVVSLVIGFAMGTRTRKDFKDQSAKRQTVNDHGRPPGTE